MAQIGFTAKKEPVYDRFNKMRRDYVEKHGRTYAPDFLTVLMDAFEVVNRLETVMELDGTKPISLCADIEQFALKLAVGIVEMQINTAKKAKEGLVNPDHIDPELLSDDWAMWIEQQFEEFNKPVSLRAYIADIEVNEQVIIKQSDGSQYLEKMLAHNHNAYLTPQRSEAMVFDNRDQATAFLRKCGHEVVNWIIEPA